MKKYSYIFIIVGVIEVFFMRAIPLSAQEENLLEAPKITLGTLLAKQDFSKKDYSVFEKRKSKNEKDKLKGIRQLYRNANSVELSDPALVAALESKHDQIIEGLSDNFPEMPISITDSMGMKAVTSDSGEMAFGTGLLLNTQYEDEMVFAIAHETSHVILDHFKAQENRKAVKKTLGDITVILAEVDKYTNKNMSRKTADVLKIATAADKFIGPAWDRGQEYEADKMAIDLMIRAGYSPLGGSKLMERMKNFEDEEKKKLRQSCGGDEKLAKDIFGALFLSQKIPQPVKAECKGIYSPLKGLFKTHASFKSRKKKIKSYLKKHYRGRNIMPMKKFSGGNMLAYASPNGPIMRSIKASRSIEAYRKEDFDTARKLAIESLDPQDKKSPKPRIANYLILKHDGKLKQALEHLDISITSEYATHSIYDLRIIEHEEALEYSEAINLLKDVGDLWDEENEIKPQLIRLWAKNGDVNTALEVYEGCKVKKEIKGKAKKRGKKKVNKAQQKKLKKISNLCEAAAEEAGIVVKEEIMVGELAK